VAQTTPTTSQQTRPGLLWTQQLRILPEDMQSFFVKADKVFLMDPEGYPGAFQLHTGEQLWRWQDRGTVYGVDEDTVYLLREDKRLYALDSATGQPQWKAIFDVYGLWPLWIGRDTVHVPFGVPSDYAAGHSVFATVDKRTGSVLWWSEGVSEIVGVTDQTAMDCLHVSPTSCWRGLRGLDPTTGAEKWTAETDLSCATVQVSGTDFFYLPENRLVAASIGSGSVFWHSERVNIQEIIAVTQGTVHAEYEEGGRNSPSYLTAIDRHTGKELWTRPSRGSFMGEFEWIPFLSDERLGFS